VSADLLRRKEEAERRLIAKEQVQARVLNGAANKSDVEALRNEIAKLVAECDDVDTLIRATSPMYASLIKPKSMDTSAIQQQLDTNSILLEYFLGDQRSYVWAITPNSINGYELKSRAEIEAAAVRLDRSITERNRYVKNESQQLKSSRIAKADAEYFEASAALSRLVIEPVTSMPADKRLIIVADGALQKVSFAALPAREIATVSGSGSQSSASQQKVLLIENHEIVYEPSASVFALQRHELKNRKPGPYGVAVFANPVFDKDDPRVSASLARINGEPATAPKSQNNSLASPLPSAASRQSDITRALDDIGLDRFPPLLHSSDEASSIIGAARQGRTMAALNFDASRAKAMSAELSKYRIVHFATHGVVDFDQPELSGIVFSLVDEKGQPQDGYLRLHDIYNLNLPADLVVLSACQTAVGKQIKGEGLIALTRGFMYAGAQRIVASLWKVDDAATAELMAEFYQQMLVRGLKPAAALRMAQLKLSQKKRWQSPYYWAGFVLQGEWK
jgi:CHAT domain-containing protein